MKKSSQRKPSSKRSPAARPNLARQAFRLSVGPLRLPAVACLPSPCRGWVVCASSEGRGSWDGWGESSAKIPPADILDRLHASAFATLEIDLVDRTEKDDQLIRFDIPLLAKRLLSATDWIRQNRQNGSNKVAFLATGNAAGAALWSTVQKHSNIAAVVSLQGRPHLAEPLLGEVSCPTLLLVEGEDPRLLQMNQQAEHRLNCPSRLVSVLSANPRERREGWKRLSQETVGWIGGHIDRPPTAGSLFDSVRSGWAPRFKRQFLAALAFLSFSLALPQSARTDSETQGRPLKKAEPRNEFGAGPEGSTAKSTAR